MEVKQGYKETEVGVIPEDWDVARLKDLTTLITDGAHLSPPTEKNGYPIATVENINKGYIDLDSCRVISSKDYQYLVRNNCKPLIGDVLLSKDGTIGITFPIDKEEDVVLLSSIAIIRPQKEKLDSVFLSKSLSSEWFYVFLDRVKAGSALTRIVLRDISKYVFPLPPTKAEQTAIATALSDADALINSLEKLIAKKRNIKQGAMQQLLKPKEGWELKKLGEIAEIVGGGTPSSFIPHYWNGTINWFTPTEVGMSKYTFESVRKITKEGFINCSGKMLPVGTILLTTRAGIGDLSILMIEACTNQGFQSLIAKAGHYNEFLYYLMQTLKNVLIQNASGSTFLEISPNKIRQIEISIPSYEEQTRIATILSDMDAEILALETKLEKYRKIKLGMMQNLLTGKIRLV